MTTVTTLTTTSALPTGPMWERKGIDEAAALTWAQQINATTLYYVPVARAAYVPVAQEQKAEDE